MEEYKYAWIVAAVMLGIAAVLLGVVVVYDVVVAYRRKNKNDDDWEIAEEVSELEDRGDDCEENEVCALCESAHACNPLDMAEAFEQRYCGKRKVREKEKDHG